MGLVNKKRSSYRKPGHGARKLERQQDVSSGVMSKPVSRRVVPGKSRLAASD